MRVVQRCTLLVAVFLIASSPANSSFAQLSQLPQTERKFKDTDATINKFALPQKKKESSDMGGALLGVDISQRPAYQAQGNSTSFEVVLLQAKIKALEKRVQELEAEVEQKSAKK